jgi:hypothetical protein
MRNILCRPRILRRATAGVIAAAALAAAVTTAIAQGPTGYPGGHYPTPHSEGQFDRLQVDSFKVTPSDQLATNKFFGLRHTDTFLDVLVTGTSGKFYLISNVVRDASDGSLTGAPWLGADVSSPTGLVPDPRYKPWTGSATQTLTSGNRLKYSVMSSAGPEHFSYGEQAFEYESANGDIHLTGSLAGQGTQWLLPWRDPTGATDEMFYNQQGYHVSGTYFGEHVSGHVVVETMWGNEDYAATWWVQNRIGHWAFLVNNYRDGSSEFGQILCGEYGARGAVIVNNKGQDLVDTTSLNATLKPDGHVLYDFGNDNRWEFTPVPTHGFPPIGRTKLAVGTVTRIGAHHKLDSGDAVYLIADRMCQPQKLGR